MSGLLEVFIFSSSVPPDLQQSLPPAMYFAKILPILIGALVWLVSPNLAKYPQGQESLSSEATITIGTFLLGLYLIGNNLPEVVVQYTKYKQFTSIGQVGSMFATGQLVMFKVLVGKVIVGLLFVILSTGIGRIYKMVRQFGA